MDKTFTIQLASKISGVGVHTIRAWEKRYKAVVPKRSDSGRREYTKDNIERLRILCELCTLGHSIGQIAKLESNELEEMLSELGKIAQESGEGQTDIDIDRNPLVIDSGRQGLLLALENYKLDVIGHELNKLKLLLTPRQLVFEIIAPLLREMGTLVGLGRLGQSQQKALESIIRFHMGNVLFQKVSKTHHSYSTILMATPEGVTQELIQMQLALLCMNHSYNMIYLGTELSPTALGDAYRSVNADVLILTSSPELGSLKADYLEKFLNKLEQKLPTGAKVLLYAREPINHQANPQIVQFRQIFGLTHFQKEIGSFF